MLPAIAFLAVLARVLWMFTILLGTSYVVFWLGFSGWWWLLAIILLGAGAAPAKITTSETTMGRPAK